MGLTEGEKEGSKEGRTKRGGKRGGEPQGRPKAAGKNHHCTAVVQCLSCHLKYDVRGKHCGELWLHGVAVLLSLSETVRKARAGVHYAGVQYPRSFVLDSKARSYIFCQHIFLPEDRAKNFPTLGSGGTHSLFFLDFENFLPYQKFPSKWIFKSTQKNCTRSYLSNSGAITYC